LYDAAQGSRWSRPPAFPSGAGGLVSTVDDYYAFAQMLLNQGEYNGKRILSRALVEEMTTNQLTPEQQAAGSDILGDSGWGFGVAVTIRGDELTATPGRYGWAGGLGTSWSNDPNEELIGILLSQVSWTSAGPPSIVDEFWRLVYQALED
jgi:CubicO group peptidase (beta-lactamase class C family)